MTRPIADHLSPGEANAWRATLCGLCASLVGIGLARFAYTPLLPAIIGAGWFGAASATYLGAANLAGYWPAPCWRRLRHHGRRRAYCCGVRC